MQSSISEGLPISILEAALCGLCVVCTNVGGCAELLAAPPGGPPGEPQKKRKNIYKKLTLNPKKKDEKRKHLPLTLCKMLAAVLELERADCYPKP